MPDAKDEFSDLSTVHVADAQAGVRPDETIYKKSKAREEKHNEQWKSQSVNLNEVCEQFASGAHGSAVNGKVLFKGERYIVIADMASGYVRIYDTESGLHVLLDGTPSADRDLTHFKILRREEM